jgi:hypothetical protein
MAKITFRAEVRIPRQVILPLAVAHAAQSPRTLLIDKRTLDVDPAIVAHLEQRYPKWVDPKKEQEPSDDKPLEKMTIAELTALAEAEGIDLGKAKLHADIVKVIADHKPADEDGGSEDDDEAADDPDPDAEEADNEDADEEDSAGSDA